MGLSFWCLCTEPWSEGQLRTVALFAITPVNTSPTGHQSQATKGYVICVAGTEAGFQTRAQLFSLRYSNQGQGRGRVQRWHSPASSFSGEGCSQPLGELAPFSGEGWFNYKFAPQATATKVSL